MENVEVTAEQINELLATGMSKTEVGEEFGLSPQKIGMILKSSAPVVESDIEVPAGKFAKEFEQSETGKITIMTAEEYGDYSKANGRFEGRKKGQKTEATIEELRALINSGRKPQYMMDKWGLDEEEFKDLVWKLSKRELRDKPLRFDIKRDFIQVG
jgi:hypothetical protein